ncbi:MAG: hypothetical protein IJM21_05480 [Clostridia bacterium]|nr:hypothetical protein [Clostridia bacterium]
MEQTETSSWEKLSYEEKNRVLYERQKALLETFLRNGALTRKQYEKSLHDLTEKMKR